MNKNPVPKPENAAATATDKPASAVAGTAAATKVTRVRRPPVAKKTVAKAAVNPASKPAVKQTAASRAVKKTAAQVAAPAVKQPVASRPVVAVKEKAKKTKLVRDSFTMPEDEFAVLGKVKKASLKAGFNVRKSELLRIGVALVDQLSTTQLQSALADLTPLKAGRPKKDK